MQEVRRAAVLVLQQLAARPDEQQFDALADLFPADPTEIKGRNPSNRLGVGPTPPRPALAQTPSPLEVSRTVAGFSVRAPRDRPATGTEWSLRFAYDAVRGNPFGLFDRGAQAGVPDFSLGHGVEVSGRSTEVERSGHNALLFRVLGEDLRLDVTGLDDRDVIVDVQPVEADRDPEDEEPAA